jgi:hypothetical protein
MAEPPFKKENLERIESIEAFVITLARPDAHDAGGGGTHTVPSAFNSSEEPKLVPATGVLPHSRQACIPQTVRIAFTLLGSFDDMTASRTAVGCGVRPRRAQALSNADPSSRVVSGSKAPVIGKNRSIDGMSTLHTLPSSGASGGGIRGRQLTGFSRLREA